jgi:hypothetical protein
VPIAGDTAVNVAVNVSVYLPLLEFFALTEPTAVTPLTATEFGKAQVVFDAAGDTTQASDRVWLKPLIGVMVSVDVANFPGETVTDAGVAAMPKSVPVALRLTICW